MKRELKIVIVGGTRGKRVALWLKRKYTNVKYFKNEEHCLQFIKQKPDILIVDESLRGPNALNFLNSVREVSNTHILFLSSDSHFRHIMKVFKLGASEYIIKDSYLYYSINKFIERFLDVTDGLSQEITYYECRNESPLKFLHPFKFKLLQYLTRP